MKQDSKPSLSDEPVVLAVTGMSCAACATRIEKKLNRLEGVTATVNYATSKATVHTDSVALNDLVTTIEDLGYGAVPPEPSGEGASTTEIANEVHLADIRRRLVVAVTCALPVMLVSMVSAWQFDGWQWVCLVLALPVALWSALPFHRAAWRNARHGATTMDTLVSLGVIVAMAWSMWALFFGGAGEIGMKMDMSLFPRTAATIDHDGMLMATTNHHEIYLEVATTLVAFLLAGRYFELVSRSKAGSAIRALATVGAKSVTLWRDGVETRIPIGALGVGETFAVRPGEKIATDGVVVEGSSAVDQSLVTGESNPVDVKVGDDVTGGTLNTNGRLLVRATRIGRDTVLAQMARLVERAQDAKAPVQRLADRVSSVFVPAVISLSLVTLVSWLTVTGDTERSFQAAVSVLVIACPCALGLATPVALLVGTGQAARSGIIIKGAQVLEASRAIDVIVLDKTGTLTTGSMTLVSVEPTDISREVLVAVAALESSSEHPIARAIVDGLKERGITPDNTSVESFVNEPGVGVSGTVDGRQMSIRRSSADLDSGDTVVEVIVNDVQMARLAVRDVPKSEAAQVVSDLKRMGVRPMIVSGDSRGVVENVARLVGIDPADTRSQVLPADKLRVIEELRVAGHRVGMVGDGVNDAPALVASDLGVAMGTGTDAAMEAGDLTIVSGDLRLVPTALALSRRTLRIIRANLFWAFAYNVAALPLAVAGLMNPVLAGLAMALSSAFVVMNSLRLRR